MQVVTRAVILHELAVLDGGEPFSGEFLSCARNSLLRGARERGAREDVVPLMCARSSVRAAHVTGGDTARVRYEKAA